MSIRYVPLGDSYTAGTGVSRRDSWVEQLVYRLKDRGVAIDLVANPAQDGWTTHQVLDFEIPVLRREQANFTTLLIGTNDWAMHIEPKEFSENISRILDTLLQTLHSKEIIVLTCPDFSWTPSGRLFGDRNEIRQGISEYNRILQAKCKERDILCLDLYEVSLSMNETDCSSDGTHPNAFGYQKWIDVLFDDIVHHVKQL